MFFRALIHIRTVLLKHIIGIAVFACISGATVLLIINSVKTSTKYQNQYAQFSAQSKSQQTNISSLKSQLAKAQKDLEALKNQDQYKRNEALQKEIESIQKTYKQAVSQYESMQDLTNSKNQAEYNKLFAQSLNYLSNRNYASAEGTLATIKTKVDAEKAASIAAAGGIDTSKVPTNATPPGSGFSRQMVPTDVGSFLIDVVAADMGSTRVIVDTASDNDCHDNCPVLSLGDYVSRNGAFAGINGSYFCPASYPSCAGKTNSFDLLAMNKNKHYFNSDNNVYSNNPVVVFGNGSIRFVGQGSGWGRDTGVDGVLMNYPMVVSGSNVAFGGDDDPKKGSKGTRSFVGHKGNTVYIGVARNVTVAEMGHALKAMGMEDAMNLDSGGSTALWYSGYKAGPGRNIPNAILFVRK